MYNCVVNTIIGSSVGVLLIDSIGDSAGWDACTLVGMVPEGGQLWSH